MPEFRSRSFDSLLCSLDLQAQVVDRVGVPERVFVSYPPGLIEIEKRLVKRLHPEFTRTLHHFLDFLCTSPLKMRSEISGELSMISTAATRPLPSFFGNNRWEISARRFNERSIKS